MTATERRASASLASIFALRMLGLFLVLPVFALEAARYPGGDDPARIGLAMGIYGLTQGLLQIPFGIASDWWGRKPVIISGLVIFALGSFIAAWAPDLDWLVAGRALQGAGAISAAVTALLADSTALSRPGRPTWTGLSPAARCRARARFRRPLPRCWPIPHAMRCAPRPWRWWAAASR